jgi:GNAT superfamily N-acetyltransferase
MVLIRPAVVDDVPGLATVHVAAWRAAYPGLMPQEYLDALDVSRSERFWSRRWSQDPAASRGHLLVAEQDGHVVGFAAYGSDRDRADRDRADRDGPDGNGPDGELYALNLHPRVFGTGVGSGLLAAAERGLVELGFSRALLWVVPGNRRARRFYERQGWRHDGGDREVTLQGVVVDETRYVKAVILGGTASPGDA